jgi:glucokinase-like ROK family protein
MYPSPSATGIKNLSKHLVLDMIRFVPGGISRVELARKTDLTRSAVSTIVDDLVKNGLVRESNSGPAVGGRPPMMLEVNPGRGFVVGVDIGVANLNIVVADFSSRVAHEVSIPFDTKPLPDTSLPILDQQVRQAVAQAGVKLEEILSIGVAVPGPVMVSQGAMKQQPMMPAWEDYPLQMKLEDLWGCPISLHSDAELGALGEWALGSGRGEQHLAFVKVGTGISSGLLLDGRLYNGSNGYAGGIGHIVVMDDGPICTCGKRGCLEAVAGGSAIAQNARESIIAGRRTQLAAMDLNAITARDVANAARMGDLLSQQIFAEAGAYLGVAIAEMVNLLNPGLIIVGGAISLMGDLLVEPIRQVVRENGWIPAARTVRITAATLGQRSSAMGAVIQALNVIVPRLIAA